MTDVARDCLSFGEPWMEPVEPDVVAGENDGRMILGFPDFTVFTLGFLCAIIV